MLISLALFAMYVNVSKLKVSIIIKIAFMPSHPVEQNAEGTPCDTLNDTLLQY
jgi:hypothetical protein